jgi:hypothetical protein
MAFDGHVEVPSRRVTAGLMIGIQSLCMERYTYNPSI